MMTNRTTVELMANRERSRIKAAILRSMERYQVSADNGGVRSALNFPVEDSVGTPFFNGYSRAESKRITDELTLEIVDELLACLEKTRRRLTAGERAG